MLRRTLWLAFAALLSATTLAATRAAEPDLISVVKIWDAGQHNAFTDLIRWRDHWFCTFREAEGHVGGDGQIRVLVSNDGQKWESAALLGEQGIDLRDPKLSTTPDDRLMIVAGGSVYEGKTLKGRQPRVIFSTDGRQWTAPQRVLSEGDWLWRVTWHGGTAWGVAYDASQRGTAAAQEAAKTGVAPLGPADWKLKLVASGDGTKFDVVQHLDVPGHPNETTLRFLSDGEMVALVRREGGSTFGWIGRSQPPYVAWKWTETKHRFGGPNFIRLPDGSLWAAGRSYPGGAKTILARMTADGTYEPALTFPSGGDTSYPGLVWHDGRLWMSYYSSHEGKTSIYLATIKVPLVAEDIGTRLEPVVDGHLLDRTSGSTRLVPQKPQPRELVLTADKPWEGNTSAYFTILQDGDKLRMYYRGSHYDEETKKSAHPEVACYAESTDGIHWTKPELGLVEYEGSKQNNIVWNGPGAHNFTPFLDTNPQCSPESRYKALASAKPGLFAFQSADGLRWRLMSDKPVITKGAFDSQNLAFWDPHLSKYREFHRTFRKIRDIQTGMSDDFLAWTEPKFLDYPGATPEHLYTNAIRNYPGAPHILIGFPTRFSPAGQQVEPIFMASRDGSTFRRYGEAIIPKDATPDRAGNRSNYMAWGLLTGEREWSVYGTEAYYTGPASRLRRFTYRPHGLVALTAKGEPGEALTRPLTFAGRRLVLNYRTAEKGSIRVELQDSAGQPLAAFAAEKCQPLTGDALAATVAWNGDADLGSLAGQPVRIRFVLQDAELFSLRFE
ncbi:MAG: sialidase family protein [Pirellulaceae bacterium]|nr:sialidase family protein [Pirellulaceae bacterium]